MAPTKTHPITDTPSMVHPVVFSHPDDDRAVPRQLRGTPSAPFEPLPAPDEV
ncbi:hypothetical protein Q5530_28960 [Saccharothrix sp. BKS2]|uniref:hypothetical protein n=1 Tax=Saccharothrix sp. BKS2 TaxID=3064400 RepID=UPI0039E9A540